MDLFDILIRLGLTEINPVYINGLKTCLSLPQVGLKNIKIKILISMKNNILMLKKTLILNPLIKGN